MVKCILGIWLSNSKTSNAEWLDKRIEACRNVCFLLTKGSEAIECPNDTKKLAISFLQSYLYT